MVQSVVHLFFSFLLFWLRIHQLWLVRILKLGNLLPNALVAQVLSLQKGLLVRQKLFLRAGPLVFGPIDFRSEAALLDSWVLFLLPLGLKFANPVLFPRGKALNVFKSRLLTLQFFLASKKVN